MSILLAALVSVDVELFDDYWQNPLGEQLMMKLGYRLGTPYAHK